MSAAPQAPAAWGEVLDQLETDVEDLHDALERGEVVPLQAWAPPRDLGPLPAEHEERAQQLAERITRLQTRTRAQLDDLNEQLGDVERRRRAGTAYAR